ncbi:MAG: hypothetical protein MUF49_13260 [Oculatellaceae cyanobacterium Prado106]|jgi:hypothetical protein|nr:hypothetical protein [Oculatellaceae cyanobacterium Prado106]
MNAERRSLLSETWQLIGLLTQSSEGVDEHLLERRKTRLRELQQELKVYAHAVQRDRLPTSEIPLSIRQAFVKATLLLTRYRQVGGSQWRGTLRSPTLSQYHPDPLPAFLSDPAAIATLCQTFDLPLSFQQDLQQSLQAIDSQIDQQKRIVQAVWQGVNPEPFIILQRFRSLFGDFPVPEDAIACIYTDLQIYFCLDFSILETQTDPTLQSFLKSLGEFSFERFRRFPIFGACDPNRVNREWCDRLAQTVGCSPSQVLQTLSRSVAIVPTAKAEAFLLHDIWGHHWQWLLTDFRGDYHILANCSEPLRAGETAYTSAGPLTCQELFEVQGDRVQVNEGRSRLFFQAEVRQRLGLLFTHLIGELLADVAEFKFIWDNPQSADQLLSSSLFKTEPAKLDLSLTDLDFLFVRILKPLLEIQLAIDTESPLEMELSQLWAEQGYPVQTLAWKVSLKRAIAHLHQIFLEEYEATYLPEISDHPRMTFPKIVCNLLDLQYAINDLYTDRHSITADQSQLPFQDLLMLLIGCICSGDSYADFWGVDEAIAHYFLPCWYLLSEINQDFAEQR